jgi:hypothetical protein
VKFFAHERIFKRRAINQTMGRTASRRLSAHPAHWAQRSRSPLPNLSPRTMGMQNQQDQSMWAGGSICLAFYHWHAGSTELASVLFATSPVRIGDCSPTDVECAVDLPTTTSSRAKIFTRVARNQGKHVRPARYCNSGRARRWGLAICSLRHRTGNASSTGVRVGPVVRHTGVHAYLPTYLTGYVHYMNATGCAMAS